MRQSRIVAVGEPEEKALLAWIDWRDRYDNRLRARTVDTVDTHADIHCRGLDTEMVAHALVVAMRVIVGVTLGALSLLAFFQIGRL